MDDSPTIRVSLSSTHGEGLVILQIAGLRRQTLGSPEVLKGLPGLTQKFGEVSQV